MRLLNLSLTGIWSFPFPKSYDLISNLTGQPPKSPFTKGGIKGGCLSRCAYDSVREICQSLFEKPVMPGMREE